VLEGYDEDGALRELAGTHLTTSLTLGLEWFLSPRFSCRFGTRAHLLLGNELDNVGLSSLYGPGFTDANESLVEGFLGLTVFLGTGDRDRDGLADRIDACPHDAEDYDGFEDADGCPDEDNDQDGVPDARDACPDVAEDRDGFADDDGCPDPDNDGDGIPDAVDMCPDAAEDPDGFRDRDGCPEPDNDGDGVPDAEDECPDTRSGARVDARGCPRAPAAAAAPELAPDLVLEGVGFLSGSAELTTSSLIVLEEVARSLLAHPEAVIEVRGHTDSTGPSEGNRLLSQRRAAAVREVLIRYGVAASRITAVGYGEDYPIAPNDTREGRARNRRVEIHRLD
jgi:outer membrane protein OmpA-like peptidoglycan-associated protein